MRSDHSVRRDQPSHACGSCPTQQNYVGFTGGLGRCFMPFRRVRQDRFQTYIDDVTRVSLPLLPLIHLRLTVFLSHFFAVFTMDEFTTCHVFLFRQSLDISALIASQALLFLFVLPPSWHVFFVLLFTFWRLRALLFVFFTQRNVNLACTLR